MPFRSSPSGPTFDTVIVRPIQSLVGWDLTAPAVLELVEAEHDPGLYMVGFDLIARVAAASGSVARAIAYSAPLFGATSIVGVAAAVTGGTGHVGGISWTWLGAASTGVDPIVLTLTPSSVSGDPIFDIYAAALRIGDLP